MRVKKFNQFINEQRVPYNELQEIVKDYIGKEIQFIMTDINKYVKGNIDDIDYHTNGKGFSVVINNYESGDGVKDGNSSISIYPNENSIIFFHNDYKSHPIDSLNDFTTEFFNFIKEIDFSK
jgi:hypothetical protein